MQGTDSEKAESMAEKLARWKAQKASVDGSTSSLPLNKPLTRQKTNILPSKGPAVTLTKKKAQLPEPKKTLKPKGASQEMPPSVSKSAPSVTQTLPKNVFESALAIVDALCEDEKEEEESPPIPIQTRATPPRRLLPDARSPSGSLFSSLPNSSTEIPILEKRIQELELEVVSLNDEKSDFLGTISRLEKSLHSISQEKDLQILELTTSHSELQSKLSTLTTQLSDAKSEARVMGAEVLALEETLVQGLQDKSALDEKLARFLTENENLKKELEDFESLMEDMKAVAQESEDKDALIAELRLEDEKKEEAFFALEAQLFKVEQDALDSLDAFETLKADFNLVAEQLEVYREKEQIVKLDQCIQTTIVERLSMPTQTTTKITLSSLCQTDPLPAPKSVESEKQFAILKMSNSVMFQEIQEIQRAHDAVVKEMQDRMASENEKWQQLELTQTAMQRKIMEALEKAVNKNRELKRELEVEKEKNAFFKSSGMTPEKAN